MFPELFRPALPEVKIRQRPLWREHPVPLNRSAQRRFGRLEIPPALLVQTELNPRRRVGGMDLANTPPVILRMLRVKLRKQEFGTVIERTQPLSPQHGGQCAHVQKHTCCQLKNCECKNGKEGEPDHVDGQFPSP